MSGGEQQMVAIARAMMSAPTILMLDEPSLGLSPLLCNALFKTLAQIRETGIGILLVEQNARQALAIADRGYLLENGRVVGEGPAAELARDAAVQIAYLGGAAAESGVAPARPVPQAAPASSRTAPGVEQLIHGSLDELVRSAATIQAEHVRATRSERKVAPPARTRAAPRALDASLQEAIARIEAAARAAANGTRKK